MESHRRKATTLLVTFQRGLVRTGDHGNPRDDRQATPECPPGGFRLAALGQGRKDVMESDLGVSLHGVEMDMGGQCHAATAAASQGSQPGIRRRCLRVVITWNSLAWRAPPVPFIDTRRVRGANGGDWRFFFFFSRWYRAASRKYLRTYQTLLRGDCERRAERGAWVVLDCWFAAR